ncbi:MAG TPA: ATP-binding protein [Steroidobacter sp.]|jgi:light-regulated signal transduction histidine kinase (bacteriophytochrome)|nr:ATP-binding protein [Steroidobacteraceae bacterium]HLS81081.1 ATP-binding protein [Steroidobacter sp.]
MPRRIALIYLACGALWIFFTDRALLWLDLSLARIAQLQTFAGWLFVLGSAALVYFLLRRFERSNQATLAALLESQTEARRMNQELERRIAERTRQLEAANRELESFAYAVSHDLRAPLRSLSGFSQILQESSPPALDDKSKHYLRRIQDASQRMSRLLEDLLGLSRINRGELALRPVDLSRIFTESAAAMRERYPDRPVEIEIAPQMQARGDARLLRLAADHLLDNAWKYTSTRDQPRVQVGLEQTEHGPVYFVRDNGVGFDMAYADKLFTPFQRLHAESQFSGSGIGLVTVQRILARHGGRIWAHAEPDQGAVFYFTLGE